MSEVENSAVDMEPQEEEVVRKGRKNKKDKPKKPLWREILEWILTLAAAVVIAMVVRTYIFEPVRVDGNSMNDTLVNGEVMFVTKYDYLQDGPERFDVVICHYPDRGNTNFVKRVVGLPGDIVAVQGGKLIVNGVVYEEEYITHRPNYTLEPYTVPEGKYFVLGDNRSNSNDSHLVGPLDAEMIVGHVRQVLLPLSSWRTVE